MIFSSEQTSQCCSAAIDRMVKPGERVPVLQPVFQLMLPILARNAMNRLGRAAVLDQDIDREVRLCGFRLPGLCFGGRGLGHGTFCDPCRLFNQLPAVDASGFVCARLTMQP
jgi:hypothetical protein